MLSGMKGGKASCLIKMREDDEDLRIIHHSGIVRDLLIPPYNQAL